MAWLYLFVAGIFEVLWASLLKSSDGLSRLWPSLGFLAALFVSMLLLALSMRHISMSVAYPIWTGIGALGSFIVGVMVFGEALSMAKAFFVMLLLVGVIGLKVTS